MPIYTCKKNAIFLLKICNFGKMIFKLSSYPPVKIAYFIIGLKYYYFPYIC